MKHSTHYVLTTHTGSLPRPADLVDMILRKEAKEPVDENVLATRIHGAVGEVVKRQAEIGIAVLNDGAAAYSDEIATDSEANRHSIRAKRQSEKSERSDAGILYIA